MPGRHGFTPLAFASQAFRGGSVRRCSVPARAATSAYDTRPSEQSTDLFSIFPFYCRENTGTAPQDPVHYPIRSIHGGEHGDLLARQAGLDRHPVSVTRQAVLGRMPALLAQRTLGGRAEERLVGLDHALQRGSLLDGLDR